MMFEKPGHKLHQLFFHVPEYMKKNKSMTFFTEQVIEHCHAAVNKDLRRVKTRDSKKRLMSIIVWAYERTVLFDEYGLDCIQLDIEKEARTEEKSDDEEEEDYFNV
ncbi:unnamed protein product [Bursaphelenchus okinawaensis]|uniref:Uncharacterized protein n=1 Tax=Bursaphelenchus okinawaensis TaxID=465554 RepID=A0A811JVB6_9BILA|nr:unnamed protein product [Bursaphelenchus okinawaensis]CAG9084763.1 unnamed protein product [Bursaphelenchus okinawaensis]